MLNVFSGKQTPAVAKGFLSRWLRIDYVRFSIYSIVFPQQRTRLEGTLQETTAQPVLLNRIMQCMHVKVLFGVSGTPAPV